ncbi:MAG: CBO0543 family protein [Ectobacillus sp.]
MWWKDLIRFSHGLIWIAVAYKWADWKNWHKYYSTFLFFAIGDLIYNFVFSDKILWQFQSGIVTKEMTELFVISTMFGSTTLLFLSKYPEEGGIIKKAAYNFLWVCIYTFIEVIMTAIGLQKHFDGWNMYWSIFHNCWQFPLLRLHYKRPLSAWLVAVIILILMMWLFDVPFLKPQ